MPTEPSLRPAFRTTRGALLYACSLLLLLASPWVIPFLPGYRPAAKYFSMPVGCGNFYVDNALVVAAPDPDIDVLFIGASAMGWGLNHLYLQNALSAHWGRQATVRRMVHPWESYDMSYRFLADVLARHRVHMVVVSSFGAVADCLHPCSHRLWLLGEDPEGLSGLPARDQASLYAGSMLATHRRQASSCD